MRRAHGWIAAGVALGVFAWRLVEYWGPFEDAYITFRYAEHIAGGHGAVFNIGEPPVEGFSSPLWTLLLAGMSAVGLPVPAVAQLLSASFAAGSVALTAALPLTLRARGVWATQSALADWVQGALPCTLLTATGALGYWGGTGMEATLALFLLVLGVFAVATDRPASFVGALLAALFLARPEALPLCVVLVAHVCGSRRRLRARLAAPVLLVLACAALLAARAAYFGDILPNTYYAKVGGALGSRLSLGVDYVGDWVVHTAGFLPLGFAAVALLRRGEGAITRVLAWIVVLTAASAIYVGGDAFAFDRLLLPATWAGALLVGRFAARWLDAPSRRRRAAAALPAVGLLLAVSVLSPHVPEMDSRVHPGQSTDEFLRDVGNLNHMYFTVGRHLAARFAPTTLVATNAAGIIPYASGLPSLDMLGLTDRHIAHEGREDPDALPGHQRYDTEYVLRRAPDVILLGFPSLADRPRSIGELAETRYLPGDRALLANPLLERRYELRHDQLGPRGEVWFSYLRRRGSGPSEGD